MTQGRGKRPRVFYGWWLVAITGLVMSLTSVPLFHALGVWSVALRSDFGWSRTQLSFAFVLSRAEAGFFGPVEGYLSDRLGTRRMVLIGSMILGPGYLLFGQTHALWMFYLTYVIMSVGNGLGGWIPMVTALNNWFLRRRAIAVAWANVGNRLGALLLIPLIAWAVDPDAVGRLGWQNTARILGIIVMVAAVPLYLVIRNRPEEYGDYPDGTPPPEEQTTADMQKTPVSPADAQAVGLTAREALRTQAFWLVSFGHAFTVALLVTISSHLAIMLKEDLGFSLQTAAWVITAYIATSMVCHPIGGYVGDHMPKPLAIFVSSVIQGASVFAITLTHSVPMAFVFAVVFGIGDGGRNPLTLAIRGDYFGRRSYATILGLSQIPMNLTILLAPLLTGVYRDVWGSYTPPFLAMAAISVLGGTLFLFSKNPMTERSAARTPALGD